MSFDIRRTMNHDGQHIYQVSLVNCKGYVVESFENADFNCIMAWIECRQCSL